MGFLLSQLSDLIGFGGANLPEFPRKHLLPLKPGLSLPAVCLWPNPSQRPCKRQEISEPSHPDQGVSPIPKNQEGQGHQWGCGIRPPVS